MAGKIARNRTEVDARRLKVAEMYLRGDAQYAIAHYLQVSQGQVSRDLTELRKEWLDRSINHIDQKKAIELAKLDQLEVEFWAAWERSKENSTVVITSPQGRTNKSASQVGNPAFLEGVLKCIDKRCAILGLDAPKQIAGVDEGPIIVRLVRDD